MTAVAAEAAVVVDNGRETSGETSLWHGAAAGAAARVDPLLRRISGLTRFDRVSCVLRSVAGGHHFLPPAYLSLPSVVHTEWLGAAAGHGWSRI